MGTVETPLELLMQGKTPGGHERSSFLGREHDAVRSRRELIRRHKSIMGGARSTDLLSPKALDPCQMSLVLKCYSL